MRLEAGAHSFDLSRRTLLMGVVNVTPDSFSDGGAYLDPAAAVRRILEFEDQGADIIDIGAESSRPGSSFVPAEEELRRLLPVLRFLQRRVNIPISVDTWKAGVAAAALDSGASIINSIRPVEMLRDGIAGHLIRHRAGIVMMHMRATPKEMQRHTEYNDLVGEISSFFECCARAYADAGVESDRIVLDPGIGFGKSFEGNLKLVGNLRGWRDRFGRPILAGCSRKSFLKHFAGEDSEGMRIPNAAIHAIAILKGASILRVHDMIDARRVLSLAAHFDCQQADKE